MVEGGEGGGQGGGHQEEGEGGWDEEGGEGWSEEQEENLRGGGEEMTRLVLFFLFCFFFDTLSRPRERFRLRDVMAGKEL